MILSPDQVIFWQKDWITINATLVFTWIIMALMVMGSWLITRHLSASAKLKDGQNILEFLVTIISEQIESATGQDASYFLPFIGTLFLFIFVCNILTIFPFYLPPTGSLSTTSALATCVFVAIPFYGIKSQGWRGYLKNFIEPMPIMLPMNIISELARIMAMAIRLFANLLSGGLIVGVLFALMPIFFPVIMQALGLLSGVIQAYIFAILAIVYIASGMANEVQ
jgi:F-type H+-transporting ATPase subunit a